MGVGGAAPRENMYPLNVTFFHLKLLLDSSASFTSSRMKDLCQKIEDETNFFEATETV